ncbi:MAG: CPBP family intramembrane glutamic endopeptidase [Pseudomonadota bacterium]
MTFFMLTVGSAYDTVRAAVRKHKRGSSSDKREPRPRAAFARALLGSQLFILAIIVVFGVAVQPDPAHFGFKPLGSLWPLALLTGAACYVVFLVVFNVLLARSGHHDTFCANAYVSMRALVPRERTSQVQLVAALSINPFTEELLYRGFLVYFLGTVSGSPLSFFFIGLAVCLGAHAYQHWHMMWFHVAFYVVVVAILYSPLGIVGAIGCHFVGDIYPLTQVKANLLVYRNIRRLRREP